MAIACKHRCTPALAACQAQGGLTLQRVLVALALLLALFAPLHASATAAPQGPAVEPTHERWPLTLRQEVAAFEDREGRMTSEQLWDRADLFVPVDSADQSFGVTRSTWWFRFTIDNRKGPALPMVLGVRNPLADDVRMQVRHGDGRFDRFELGDQPIRPAVIPHALDPAVGFRLEAGEIAEVLVGVRSANFLTAPLWLADAQGHADLERGRHLWQGGLMMLFAALFLYNLPLVRRMRDPAFLWYVASLPVIWLTLATESGFAGASLFPDSPWWRNDGLLLLAGLMYVTTTGFVLAFVDLAALPRLRLVLRALFALALVQCASPFVMSLHAGSALLGALLFIFPVTLLAACLVVWRDGQSRAPYLMLSQGAFWAGQVVFGLWIHGWIGYSWMARNALGLGLSLGAVFMAVALGRTISELQEARLEAELAKRRALELSKSRLEQAVAERTAELEQARLDAQAQAYRDALTGIRNRRAIHEDGAREVALARRSGRAVSLAMLDIDFFKGVNDASGHPEGDRLLKELAALLTGVLRNTDLLGRVGGEEFLIVMPDTDAPGAHILAERCRATIAARLRTGADATPVTASLGITSRRAPDETLEQMIARADAALYKAKAEGRNRVAAHL